MYKCIIIYNPISGRRKAEGIHNNLLKLINQSQFEITSHKTKYKGHANLIAKKAVFNKIDLIIVIGGDGTINEVGQATASSDTAIAIITAGSGNGFARSLKLTSDIKKLAHNINIFKLTFIDYGLINDHFFINVCGIGFDANVSKRLENIKKRGFINYIPQVFFEIMKINSISCSINIDDSCWIKEDVFWVSVFNGNNYGGFIKPNKKGVLNDGYFELLLIKNVSILYFPIILLTIIFSWPKWKKVSEIYKFKRLTIKNINKKTLVHKDGEVFRINPEIKIKNIKKGLKIIK